MKNTRKIVVTRRSDDFHACIEGNPGIWDCGKTITEAIGNLIRTHPEKFNLSLVYPD